MTTAPRPKYRIFISHSSKDDEFGIQLAQDLRYLLGDERAVWYDHTPENGLPGGVRWQRVIEKKVRALPCFIVILSPDAVKSGWVKHEADVATGQEISGRKKQIIPILFHPCKGELCLSLEKYQYITFPPADPTKTYEAALSELLMTLKPAKKMSITEIQQALKDAKSFLARRSVPPEVQEALNKKEEDVARERLRQYVWWYQTHDQLNYALHYCDMLLNIFPDEREMQAARHVIYDLIEQRKLYPKDSATGRNFYFPSRGLKLSRQPSLSDNTSTQQSQRAKNSGGRRARSRINVVKYQAEGVIGAPGKKTLPTLPALHTGLTIDVPREIGSILQHSERFFIRTLSYKELGKCSQGLYGVLFACFFATDVIGAWLGLRGWLTTTPITWLSLALLLLFFIWGIFNTSRTIALILAGGFGLLWYVLAQHYLRLPLLCISLGSLGSAILRFQLFRKHERRMFARKRR